MNHYVGVFGLGWHSRFDERLELSDEKASWYRGDGFEVVFERNGDDFERGTRSDYWLEFGSLANFPALEDVQGSRLLVLKDNQGNRIAFSESGEWVASFTSAGWQSFAKRDAQGRLLGVRSSTGRSLTIEYTDSRIAYIQSDLNDRIEYHYDPDGQLVSVTNAAGTRTYEWDDGLITSVTNETGLLEVENKYDKLGRIIWQREPFGREVRFAYLPGRVTSVSDVDGSRANTWVSDAYGRLIRVTDSEGNTQSMTFDKRGHLIQTLERDGSVTVHQYNERGLRTLTVRPESGTVNYTYDELDRLVSVEDVHGGVLTQTYEGDSYLPSMIKEPLGGEHYLEWSDGKLVSVTDSRGARSKLRYNEFAELVELIDPEGNPWKFDRDNAGRVIGFTSPLGVKTGQTFDAAGRIITSTNGEGETMSAEWFGNRLKLLTAPDGGVTEFRYGARGEVDSVIDPLGRDLQAEYDDVGNTIGVTFTDGAKWEYEYDSLSRLVKAIDPVGNVWKQAYSDVGSLTSITDPLGTTVQGTLNGSGTEGTVKAGNQNQYLVFDHAGRVKSQTIDDNPSTVYSYDVAGNIAEVVHPDGSVTVYRRDEYGRLEEVVERGISVRYEYSLSGKPVRITSSAGYGVTMEYDADGQLIRRSYDSGAWEAYVYDKARRLVAHDSSDRGKSTFSYDACGRLTRVKDKWYGSRKMSYDKAGQLLSVTNALGSVTRYRYNKGGQVEGVTNPNGHETHYDYDLCSRLIQRTSVFGRSQYAYDAVGRLVTSIRPNGDRFGFVLDAFGRRVGTLDNGQAVTYEEHDSRGKRRLVVDDTDPRGSIIHESVFDLSGRLIRYSAGADVVQYEYDARGRRTAVIGPNGERTSYSYDDAGHLANISSFSFGELLLEHDAHGNLTKLTSDGTVHEWTYLAGRVVSHKGQDASGSFSSEILRDESGHVVAVDGLNGRTSYSYDDAGQLTAVESNMGKQTWTYNKLGQITSHTEGKTCQLFQYDELGQLVSISNADSGDEIFSFSYDSLGNRVSSKGIGQETRYHYDDRGWLSEITKSNDGSSNTGEVHTDSYGRVSRVGDTRILWDQATGKPLMIGDTPVLSFHGMSVTPASIHTLGEEAWRPLRATELKQPWKTQHSGLLSRAGHIVVSNLEYMGSRVYDSETFSFLSQDPLPAVADASWAGNTYNFASNNPLSLTDPLGLRPVTDAELDAYAASLPKGALSNAGNWIKENWKEVLIRGAIIGAGVVAGALVTSVGGPIVGGVVAGAVIGFGNSVYEQQKEHGWEFSNWDGKQIIIDTSIGMATGLVTAGAGAIVSNVLKTTAMSTGQKVAAQYAFDVGFDTSLSTVQNYTENPDPSKLPEYLAANFASSAFASSFSLRRNYTEFGTEIYGPTSVSTVVEVPEVKPVIEVDVPQTRPIIEGNTQVNEALRSTKWSADSFDDVIEGMDPDTVSVSVNGENLHVQGLTEDGVLQHTVISSEPPTAHPHFSDDEVRALEALKNDLVAN